MRPALAATDDLDARIPVWVALSELYLDTDVRFFHDSVARVLAASPYPLDELQRILLDEVHPALHANLLQVAGEWAGFDDAWLVEHVQAVRRRPLWLRRLTRLSSGMVREHWRALEPMIRKARNASCA
ncbi:DUF7079 family protein [Lysobacter brunescens]|uniref:DUF7079 domain-containing protein n=1 Tax=Lysobacter brunescens TaxID=262323 RepID=A0ABW2YEN4_9GAMM